MRQRYTGVVVRNSKRVPLTPSKDVRELRARETLRLVIGDEKYRNYMKYGFIAVEGKSGLTYQLFPGEGFTRVFNRGIELNQQCVIFRGNFPPTDSLIMRYLMILNNEEEFNRLAIQHSPLKKPKVITPDQRQLTEIFREMKNSKVVKSSILTMTT